MADVRNPHLDELAVLAIGGGPGAVEALAEWLWHQNPETGESPASRWNEEDGWHRDNYREVARQLLDWFELHPGRGMSPPPGSI